MKSTTGRGMKNWPNSPRNVLPRSLSKASPSTPAIDRALSRQAAVALLGPRQVGKITLALEIARSRDALYLDLEDRDDRNRPPVPAPAPSPSSSASAPR